MEAPAIANAFLNHSAQPTPAEVTACLGETSPLWDQFAGWVKDQGVPDEEWTSFSPKYGWSFRLKRKKRNIVYLSPCDGCFRVSFVLGDKAVAQARQRSLPRKILHDLDTARRYPEGTALQLLIRKEGDLAAARKLVLIKLAN